MRKLLYFLTLFAFFSCQQNSKSNEVEIHNEDYLRHLSYLINLKNEVAKTGWPEFSKNDFFQPAVYYTTAGTLTINPNDHMRKITDHSEMKDFNQFKMIKLSEEYTDTINFNFQTSYSDTDSTALYFKENVLFFQSFDLTQKLIGIKDLQDWSIMVVHELFHGYQRAIPQFKTYYTQLDIPGGPDEYLGKKYKNQDWFKKSIYKENEILKDIWINDADLITNLKKYNSLRTARINKVKKVYGVDIREVEDYEYLMEGHARYFESLCKRFLSKENPDSSSLTDQDMSLITDMFNNYNIKEDKNLYDLYNSRYYYQIGYNISMILEKYLPDYHKTVYKEEFNFNTYLNSLISP